MIALYLESFGNAVIPILIAAAALLITIGGLFFLSGTASDHGLAHNGHEHTAPYKVRILVRRPEVLVLEPVRYDWGLRPIDVQALLRTWSERRRRPRIVVIDTTPRRPACTDPMPSTPLSPHAPARVPSVTASRTRTSWWKPM